MTANLLRQFQITTTDVNIAPIGIGIFPELNTDSKNNFLMRFILSLNYVQIGRCPLVYD